MKIEVKSLEVFEKSDVSKRTGKPYTLRWQYGFITTKAGEVRRIELPLGDKQEPYGLGAYRVDADDSLYVGKWGRLELGRLALVPYGASAKQAA